MINKIKENDKNNIKSEQSPASEMRRNERCLCKNTDDTKSDDESSVMSKQFSLKNNLNA